MVNKYTAVTCFMVFYFIVRLYIYRQFCRCLFDRSRGTKTFHKILKGTTSAKKVKKHCSKLNIFVICHPLFNASQSIVFGYILNF